MKCTLNMDNSFVLSRFSHRLRLLFILTCRLQSLFLLGNEKDKINVTETSFFYLTDNNVLHFPFDKSCKFLFSTRLKAFICSNSIGSCRSSVSTTLPNHANTLRYLTRDSEQESRPSVSFYFVYPSQFSVINIFFSL